MNARTQYFDLTLEGRQAEEAVLSLFHTILFHRTCGKFNYSDEASFSVGLVGLLDVDCNFIDVTYASCASAALDRNLRREVNSFSQQLRNNETGGVGQISLEFFQRNPGRWAYGNVCVPWEVWTARVDLVDLNNEGERQVCREKVGEVISDKIMHITEVMNRPEYLPQMPSRTQIDTIFDTSYQDVQPYLFKMNYSIAGPSSGASVGSTMKKFIRETLQL